MARRTEKRTTTLSISLPTPLAEEVSRRVESGLYGSASEVVREALRMLLGAERPGRALQGLTDSAPQRAGSDREFERPAPDRTARLRVADAPVAKRDMSAGALASARLREALELFDVGVRLTRERAVRELGVDHPDRVEQRVAEWLRQHEGAPDGDGPGRPASPERLRRLRVEPA